MKRLLIVLATFMTALYLASIPVLAQHGRPASPGASASHTSSGHGSSASSNSVSSSSPTSKLNNTKLNTALTNALSKNGVLPAGTTLASNCGPFRNLGQCIAAMHIAHNLASRNTQMNFFCLREAMTGNATLPAGFTCPSNVTPGKLSLGKAIQTFYPNINAGTETKKGTKQANDDIKNANS